MSDSKTRKLIFSALFAALCCVSTMVIKFATPTGGYIHAGDAVVLLGAFLLGPGWGALAAGLGSALADILAGYVVYAPATLVIKALMALVAGILLNSLGLKRPNPSALIAGSIAGLLMVAGYFLYGCFILGFGLGALADVPLNLLQGLFGALAGAALFGALSKIPYMRQLFGSDRVK
ncbi:MAG: ECF transporter S component [Clostridia bacterium]|nr:ECF transporter S component [Clostridia bacterium]